MFTKTHYYLYQAEIARWVDADTVDCIVDLGFNIKAHHRFRLLGINAPEKRTEEGKKAKAYVEEAYPVGTAVVLESYKQGKFGRWLAKVICNDIIVNEDLIRSGFAVEY